MFLVLNEYLNHSHSSLKCVFCSEEHETFVKLQQHLQLEHIYKSASYLKFSSEDPDKFLIKGVHSFNATENTSSMILHNM